MDVWFGRFPETDLVRDNYSETILRQDMDCLLPIGPEEILSVQKQYGHAIWGSFGRYVHIGHS